MNSGTLGMLLPLVILLAVMYFLLIRPQKKREKEINAMRSSVQVGDEVVTIGGICGKIVKTKDESLVIQVGADKVKFEIMRWAVSKVVEEGKRHSKAVQEEEEKKPSKPKRMKAVAPVEEETAEVEVAETVEVSDTAEETDGNAEIEATEPEVTEAKAEADSDEADESTKDEK